MTIILRIRMASFYWVSKCMEGSQNNLNFYVTAYSSRRVCLFFVLDEVWPKKVDIRSTASSDVTFCNQVSELMERVSTNTICLPVFSNVRNLNTGWSFSIINLGFFFSSCERPVKSKIVINVKHTRNFARVS